MELKQLNPAHQALSEEIEARESKFTEPSDAASKREDKLRMELAGQARHFAESINRLQRDLQDQMIQSAERIRELEARIEHLKITRFEAKRENYRIKTSLSWRLTWPLRLLREAGMGFVSKSRRFRSLSGWRPSSARVATNAHSAVGRGRQHPEVDRQSIERLTEGVLGLDRGRETVVVVTHEVSRAGRSVIALNLARAIRRKYNVIILALQDGELGTEFRAGCDLMIGPLSGEQRSPDFLTALFQEVAARVALQFAIVNSIFSGTTLSALWENDIAIVHLIHEFSSQIRPRGQFDSSAFYSGERIFPAEIVHESAKRGLAGSSTTRDGCCHRESRIPYPALNPGNDSGFDSICARRVGRLTRSSFLAREQSR